MPIVTYAAAVCVPLIAILLWGSATAVRNLHASKPVTPLDVVASRPQPKRDRPLVALVVSNAGTEVTDLIAPFTVFAESGAVEVVTVAPERRVSPLYPGLEVLPDFTFEQLDHRPDVVVIPNIADYDNPRIHRWLQRQAAGGALMVSVCEGARAAAAAGLLDGHTATSHFMALNDLRRKHPQVRWVAGVRYQWSGQVVTSAGVSAAMDISFSVLARVAGAEAAGQTAHNLGYRMQPREVSTPTLSALDYLSVAAFVSFVPRSLSVAVELHEGVDELEVAAVADVFQRSMLGRAASAGPERKAVRSKRGLMLVPQYAWASAPSFDRVYTVGGARTWSRTRPAARSLDADTPAAAFDRALAEVAEASSPNLARFVAKTIEYPEHQHGIARAPWPRDLWWRPAAIGLGALTLALLGRVLGLPSVASVTAAVAAAWASLLVRIWLPLWRRIG